MKIDKLNVSTVLTAEMSTSWQTFRYNTLSRRFRTYVVTGFRYQIVRKYNYVQLRHI